jgi:hypothetical protein
VVANLTTVPGCYLTGNIQCCGWARPCTAASQAQLTAVQAWRSLIWYGWGFTTMPLMTMGRGWSVYNQTDIGAVIHRLGVE